MSNEEQRKLMAEMHAAARYQARKSQEYMANELGVTKKTIQNWERGKGCPTFFQSIRWFQTLNINPFPHYFALVNPDVKHIGKFKSDEDVNKAFDELSKNLSISDKKVILYVFCGDHGSSPTAILELGLAYLHLPLKTRASHTSTVIHDYLTEEKLHNLYDEKYLPNMDVLTNAFEQANKSILNRLERYNDINE